MQSPPLISVIIPMHNNECTIRRCLDSVYGKKDCRIEIICVDDFSEDTTADIVKTEYAQVILERNDRVCGPLDSRLKGFKRSCGEYILFLDADDWVDPYFIEGLVSMAASDRLVLGAVCVHGKNEEIVSSFNKSVNASKASILDDFFSQAGNDIRWFTIWGNLIPRACLIHSEKKLSAFADLKVGEDILAMAVILSNVESVSSIVDMSYHYMRNEDGQTHKVMSYSEFKGVIKGIRKIFKFLSLIVDTSSQWQKTGFEKWRTKQYSIWRRNIDRRNDNIFKKYVLRIILKL